jgi:hypothetical protein
VSPNQKRASGKFRLGHNRTFELFARTTDCPRFQRPHANHNKPTQDKVVSSHYSYCFLGIGRRRWTSQGSLKKSDTGDGATKLTAKHAFTIYLQLIRCPSKPLYGLGACECYYNLSNSQAAVRANSPAWQNIAHLLDTRPKLELQRGVIELFRNDQMCCIWRPFIADLYRSTTNPSPSL